MTKNFLRMFNLYRVNEIYGDDAVRLVRHDGTWLGEYETVEDCLRDLSDITNKDLMCLKASVEDELMGEYACHDEPCHGVAYSETLVLWRLSRNYQIKEGYKILCKTIRLE